MPVPAFLHMSSLNGLSMLLDHQVKGLVKLLDLFAHLTDLGRGL